jgi:hypothetical protein
VTAERTVRTIAKTLAERGDAVLTFSAETDVPISGYSTEEPQ